MLLLDESLDLLLAPTLLALAPLAQVVVPAALSPTWRTGRGHLPITLVGRWRHSIREDCVCSRYFVRFAVASEAPHHDT